MKKMISIFSFLFILIIAAPVEANDSFRDVKPSSQFYTSIEWATHNDLLKGYDNGTFKPKNKLTEAQFTIILTRYLNPILTNDIYPGFEREEVYEYIESYNLPIKGVKDEKVRNRPYTRIDVAKVFATLATGNKVSEKQAVDWMYEAGITTGKGVSSNRYKDFGGGDHLKREHISAFFKRLNDSPAFIYPNTPRSAIEKASKFASKDYKLTDIQQANFDNDPSTAQYVAQYRHKSAYERTLRFQVKVLTYDKMKKTWTMSTEYKIGDYDDVYLDVISIGQNKVEDQVLIYSLEGSSAMLTARVLGYTSNSGFHVEEIPSIFYEGNYKVTNRELNLYEGDKPKVAYAWTDGKLVKTDVSIVQPGKNDIVITYDQDQYDIIHSNVEAFDTIYAKVGQKLHFFQKNSYLEDYRVRVMYTMDTDIVNYETGKFTEEGTLKVHILPNGSWEGAHEFFVSVSK